MLIEDQIKGTHDYTNFFGRYFDVVPIVFCSIVSMVVVLNCVRVAWHRTPRLLQTHNEHVCVRVCACIRRFVVYAIKTFSNKTHKKQQCFSFDCTKANNRNIGFLILLA